MAWQENLSRYFSSEVKVEAANKVGMLAAISAAIASTGTNIDHATVEQRDGDVSLITLEVEVKDRKHLARIVRTIRRMPEVLRVARSQSSRRSTPEMTRTIIQTPQAPSAIGTYSQAVRVGNTVWVSGQIPLDPATMQLVSGDIDAEIRRVFDNLEGHRRRPPAARSNDAVKVTVFLTDLAHFARVNEIMAHVLRPALPGARRSRRRRTADAAPAWRWSASLAACEHRQARRALRGGCAIPCSCCRSATRTAPASRRSARCSRARARWSRARCRSPMSSIDGAARCWCGISDGSGFLKLRFFYFSRAQAEGLARGTRLRCYRRGAPRPAGPRDGPPGVPPRSAPRPSRSTTG